MLLDNRYVLLKFMKEIYADSFLDGNIYMNTLYYFWNEYKMLDPIAMKKAYMKAPPSSAPEEILIPIENEMPEYQEDILEGAIGEASVKDEGLKRHLLSDMIIRSSGCQYCNIACFMKLKYEVKGSCIHYDIPCMNGFGGSVVIIDDEREFLRRIGSSVKKLGYKYLCGEVEYKEPKFDGSLSEISERPHLLLQSDEEVEITSLRPGEMRDCFTKAKKYSHQHEWRIALYRGVQDTQAYVLRTDSLRDIARCVSTDELVDELDDMFAKGKIAPGLPGYHGNVSRQDMRDIFHELGGHKAKFFMIMG